MSVALPPTARPERLSGAVEVILITPGPMNGAPYRLPAVVVHAQPNGAGLMLAHPHPEIAQLLAAARKSVPW